MPIFDSQSLAGAVANQLKDAGLPDDHRHAFAVIATTAGIKGVVSAKIDNIWQVDAVFSINGQKQIEGGIQVRASW